MKIKYVLFLLALVSASHAEIQKITIAVNDFRAEGIMESDARIITDRLRIELLKTGIFKVLERSEMKAILMEQDFQRSDCSSEECIIEVGQLLGVSHMIAGSIGKLGQLYTIQLRLIDVSTSEMVHTATSECRCPIEEVLSRTTKEIAAKIARIVKFSRYGGLAVTTTPSSANLFINSKKTGVTPYHNEMLEPGTYRIRIDKSTYNGLKDTVTVNKGKIVECTYNLFHTQAFIDSVNETKRSALATKNRKIEEDKKQQEIRKKQKKKRGQLIRKIVFGTLGGGLVAGGIVMNTKVSEKMEDSRQVYDDYMSTETNFSKYRPLYDAAQKKAEEYRLYRNILYGSAGAMGFGFFLSFFF